MPFLLAGIASLTFGVADFFGGLATRKAPALTVVLFSQMVGGVGVLLVAPFFGPVPAGPDLLWGVAAGAAGAVGLVMLYQALATMRIGVVAPVTALIGTATPVVFGVVIGERPSALAWLGIAVAVGAIVLIASPKDPGGGGVGGARAVGASAVSGVAFGLFGIFISRTAADSGMWPLVAARATSMLLVVLVVVAMARPFVPEAARRESVAAGSLDMIANVLFLIAVRRELLSLVTVIMAMYPASTVGLAGVVLHEPIGRVQRFGLALGALGVSLIVVG